MADRMTTELIISTYNNVGSLRLCFKSVAGQTILPGSICVADDGSGPETAKAIAEFAAESPIPVRHVWHDDHGFDKGAILNRAISTSTAEYLIFIDGDVMIAPGFIARHVGLARPDRFLTGSLIRLDEDASRSVTGDMITDGTVFSREWLRNNRALVSVSAWLKTAPLPTFVLNVIELLSIVPRSLCGANASAFRSAILAVNGYDETMKYGGQDKELGERLKNSGVRGRHLRYSAPLVHLHHKRAYATPDSIAKNRRVILDTRRTKRNWADLGIKKLGFMEGADGVSPVAGSTK